jgi:transposase
LLQTLLILSPEWFGYYATHWTVPLLKNQLRQNTGEEYSSDTIRRWLHELGYVWKRPRYVLAPDPEREKKRQIRRVLSGLSRRRVVLVEDVTDLVLFRATREVAISIVRGESDMETT